jgi:hypothetical protein
MDTRSIPRPGLARTAPISSSTDLGVWLNAVEGLLAKLTTWRLKRGVSDQSCIAKATFGGIRSRARPIRTALRPLFRVASIAECLTAPFANTKACIASEAVAQSSASGA